MFYISLFVEFVVLICVGFIGDAPVMLAKPQTFMNASGESVSPTYLTNLPLVSAPFYLSSDINMISCCRLDQLFHISMFRLIK